ncbi:NAD-dependent epimerase [Hydrogenovibrio sp. SC-1]|uniref:NAD(P)-dependent oxidoreductase n=1 Tax=Hydrogenovibrio sp. SC-1 TaxID=2065820 RepID=UPI000C7B97E9|nr:NAD(P)-binding oxidoreductase [Hydrogenovibrio sp. SC-1]PLA73796.1 NAD-dependent epimerase [Hydrogenovibrio sp. SC-1]
MSKVLVLGASGSTGRLAVQKLLQKGASVVAMVRNKKSLENIDSSHSNLQIIEAEILKISESDLAKYLTDCDGVLSCLGHNLTFKGIYGHPRRLVTDAIKKVAKTIESMNTDKKYKIILMNTAGNSNRDIPEKPPLSQRLVVSLLRLILPPHVDNEEAADFLRMQIGQNNANIEWVAVRPDGLINDDQVSKYDVYISPIKNVIFDAGQTSRINVADFMSDLAVNPELWREWKGKMPVISNHV